MQRLVAESALWCEVPIIYRIDGSTLIEYDGMPSRINWESVSFRRAQLSHLDRSATFAQGADFSGSDMTGVDLYWATLIECKLSHCLLSASCLQGCNLTRSDFSNADLRKAQLDFNALGTLTRLEGADFSGAQLAGAVFTRATYDDLTRFPATFNPASHGMIYISATLTEDEKVSVRRASRPVAR